MTPAFAHQRSILPLRCILRDHSLHPPHFLHLTHPLNHPIHPSDNTHRLRIPKPCALITYKLRVWEQLISCFSFFTSVAARRLAMLSMSLCLSVAPCEVSWCRSPGIWSMYAACFFIITVSCKRFFLRLRLHLASSLSPARLRLSSSYQSSPVSSQR